MLVIMGVAGTAAGVALAVVRERIDRISDSRAAKNASESDDTTDDADSDKSKDD